jgi:hypothetical protein
MIEENPGKDGEQDTQNVPKQAAPVPSVSAPVQPPKTVPPPNLASSQPTSQPGESHPDTPTEDVEEELSAFERQMLRVTWVAVLVAGLTGLILYSQFRIMGDQTKILSDQGVSAIAGAIESERNTREQLRIAQEQASAAQDSVRAVQKQMRQDQRAWVHFSEIKINIARDPQGRADVTAPVGIFVTGKTPAKKVRMEFVIDIVKNEQNGITRFPYAYIPRLQDTTGIIIPGEAQPTFTTHLLKRTKNPERAENRFLSVDEYQSLADGKTFVILYGRIQYRDIFNIPHETRYCHFFSPSGKDAYAQRCTEYNGVDDN